ncbi:hypothetical protein BME96_16075 [Virgibacillus halodenitrificans]|uniref:Polysaccharide pyruvyl transferase domain-containing protein n=1 Tax=Virgibacillus halodenitrificans TaxID=1482 RepID=A0AAC9NLZ7_VIRHA|nr:polysaccharide pyruvyl transferase family protein [Virgibacillus halodenitrificans]APC49615.1 hypothetical protein BME96_16075 [Virgibacillus halodenitrificans]
MKKIGIITLNGYFNYGNRLQNFALQEILKSMNYEVETVRVEEESLKKLGKENILRSVKRIIKMLFFQRIREDKKYKNIRTERFMEFSRKYINESDYFICEGKVPEKRMLDFDYFVTGSDQVWNPLYNSQSSIYFLNFVPDYKRISYAASFGISDLPIECIPNYKKWLSELAHISVREEAGADIIKELTGRKAEVVLDPTLLLSKEQWLSISKESLDKPNQKYLLTYFLGEVSQENEIKIENIAAEKNLKIVQLANIKDKGAYIADPSEFIDYIYSAELFLTDSFHGSVFSILLEKPFVIFDREGSKKSMMSRINTLLSTFDLVNRKWENIDNTDDIYNVDYKHVKPILDLERKKSLLFIESSLGLDK